MRRGLFILVLFVSGCAISPTPPRYQIALLAPFEGRDREIGYEALYAARLALADSTSHFDLLPIDDGGTPSSATERARGIARAPSILAVIVLGTNMTTPDVYSALVDLPVLTMDTNEPNAASIVFNLAATRTLDADFARRYRASDAFAPPPGDLARWTYDAARWIASFAGVTTRVQLTESLRNTS
ncbi:MAG: hypothetical protein SGI73_05135 [Chloroflexota bacterium]|nr:hypothetical protein [Chloroflexota bacterium]